jgi:head-tail adaptor
MIGAGDLIYQLQFSQRIEEDDGFGNTIAGWHIEFEARCAVTPAKGSETVVAARLEGHTTINITIRNSANARRITADWQAKDVRRGIVYQIKSPPFPTDDRAYLRMMAMSGVAA